jgi:hypothetical protein
LGLDGAAAFGAGAAGATCAKAGTAAIAAIPVSRISDFVRLAFASFNAFISKDNPQLPLAAYTSRNPLASDSRTHSRSFRLHLSQTNP